MLSYQSAELSFNLRAQKAARQESRCQSLVTFFPFLPQQSQAHRVPLHHFFFSFLFPFVLKNSTRGADKTQGHTPVFYLCPYLPLPQISPPGKPETQNHARGQEQKGGGERTELPKNPNTQRQPDKKPRLKFKSGVFPQNPT